MSELFPTREVDLEELVTSLEEDLEEIEDHAADLDSGSDEYQEYDELYGETAATLQEVKTAIDEYGGSAFTLRKPNAQKLGDVEDAVRAAVRQSKAAQDGVDKTSVYNHELVNQVVVKTPPDAPSEAGKYPLSIRQFLFNHADELTRYGDVSASDFSLSATLEDGN